MNAKGLASGKKIFFIKSTAIVAMSAVLKDCDILYADILWSGTFMLSDM